MKLTRARRTRHYDIASAWAAARRDTVAHLRIAFEVSEDGHVLPSKPIVRRSAIAAGARTMLLRGARLRELASVRRRFGYRRLHILIAREGIVMNPKNSAGEERLQVDASGRWVHWHRWHPRKAPISAGAWTCCQRLADSGASASWRSSTTSRASAWHSCPTPRFRSAGRA